MVTTNQPESVRITQSSPQPSPFLATIARAEDFLRSSTRFWFAVSTISSTLWLSFFSETNFYNTYFGRFGNRFLCFLCSAVLTLHYVLFLSHNRLRISSVTLHPILQYLLPPIAFFSSLRLHYIPDESTTGLLFVMCCWVDVIAVIQIVRPSTDFRLVPLIMTAIISRAITLYGFTGRNWLISFFCFLVLYVQGRLEGADKVGACEEMVEDTKPQSPKIDASI